MKLGYDRLNAFSRFRESAAEACTVGGADCLSRAVEDLCDSASCVHLRCISIILRMRFGLTVQAATMFVLSWTLASAGVS
jgi:hypothetical protein